MNSLSRFVALNKGRFDRVVSIFTALSIASVILMMSVSFIAVVMRYAFNFPILGINEVIQLLSVCCVFMAMPYATTSDAHVRVDIFDNAIGKLGRNLGDVLTYTISILVLSVLVYKTYFKLLDAAEYEDATNMLGIPFWPFYGVIAVGMAMYVIVLVTKLLSILFSGRLSDE